MESNNLFMAMQAQLRLLMLGTHTLSQLTKTSLITSFSSCVYKLLPDIKHLHQTIPQRRMQIIGQEF